MHASTVGVVRNLKTGRLSHQYHVVYDDRFETVHSDEDSQPLLWEELLTTSTFKSGYSHENVPSLENEWLDEEDLRKRVKEMKEQTAKRGNGDSITVHVDNESPNKVYDSSYEQFEDPFHQR